MLEWFGFLLRSTVRSVSPFLEEFEFVVDIPICRTFVQRQWGKNQSSTRANHDVLGSCNASDVVRKTFEKASINNFENGACFSSSAKTKCGSGRVS